MSHVMSNASKNAPSPEKGKVDDSTSVVDPSAGQTTEPAKGFNKSARSLRRPGILPKKS